MGLENNNYKLVGREDNDGFYDFQTEMIVTKDVLNKIGEIELEIIRKRVKKILEVKEEIYGKTEKTEFMYHFPEEIYFKNKIGNIISFTQIEARQVCSSAEDLYLVGEQNPEENPLLLKNRSCEEISTKLLERPFLVQFRTDLDF